jgi:hypothetical protein
MTWITLRTSDGHSCGGALGVERRGDPERRRQMGRTARMLMNERF